MRGGYDRRRFIRSLISGGAFTALSQWVPAPAFAAARMDSGEPSETALGAARLRAVHQILEYPRVLHDPVAIPILGPGAEAALRAELAQYQSPFARSMRASMVMRSRYADDRFFEATRRGVRQYVVLGAGLDTFAYRNQFPEAMLNIFEIDHPATQAWKRARLREMHIPVPASLKFAAVDFERQSLGEELAKAGFRRDRPAFFSWLGVSMYLTRPAVMETLRFVASLAPGSELVFDFIAPPLPGSARAATMTAAANYVARIGEPWISYFDPAALVGDLRQAGFSRSTLFGAREANLAYFAGRDDGFRVGGAQMAAAIV